jgi:predicted lipoprotein with Yx(FWY)xxD motif
MRPRAIRTTLAAAGLSALVLAACANASTPSAGGTSGAPGPVTTTSAPPATSNGGGRYGDVGGGSGGGQGTGSSSAAPLQTMSISGVGTVLTTSAGLTLYDLPSESNGTITCTGSCAAAWPPLLVAGSKLPALPAGVSGTIAKVTRPDGGVQVTYNGKPLYTWEGDSAPGQATGVGIEGFEAVTVS